MTKGGVYELSFDGAMLARGFWLYVWEITGPDGKKLHYVGRTGDSSSLNAQSPFNRMGQHLGFNEKSNVLRRYLTGAGRDLDLAKCSFRLVAHGPILGEAFGVEEHRRCRDIVAALEKELADAMREAGYEVINRIHCRRPLHPELFNDVRAALSVHFPAILKAQGRVSMATGMQSGHESSERSRG